MRIPNEMKAGIVIVLGVLLGAFFILKTTSFQAEPYELKTYFSYAGDLKKDATVKLSGIEVGRLISTKFVYGDDTKVECTLSVDSMAKVRKDSIAYIGTAGFVGDAYIGITPGKDASFLKPGDTIGSEEPIQMRELMKKADEIADGINGVVSDNREGITNTIKNLEVISENFKEFSEDVKKHPWKLLFKGE